MKITAVEPIGISETKAQEIACQLAKHNLDFQCYRDRKEDAATLVERMKDADIVIVSNIKITADMLSQCPNLKMLDVAFTGLDHIDLEYCKAHNIKVVNASGYATQGVAELAIGLMIVAGAGMIIEWITDDTERVGGVEWDDTLKESS